MHGVPKLSPAKYFPCMVLLTYSALFERFVWVITCIWVQLKNNCTSNSQVIAQGEAKCNLTATSTNACDCLLNHIALPITLSSYP